jgi:hypothetical protein
MPPRSHTHREGGKVCSFATKRECDDAVKAFLAERKRRYDEEQAKKAAAERARQEAAIDAFIAKELARMESYKET